jgi:putative flavoprotein involved in K+ transport
MSTSNQSHPSGTQLETFVEEGTAFVEIDGAQRIAVVVIGAGQAGLAVGRQLQRRGIPFVIVDAEARIGDAWRKRWDSLRLFTPAHVDGLPGLRFPGPRTRFPTKDEMADYLETYAAHFRLPVLSGVRVERVYRRGGTYVVRAGTRTFAAEHVVVAMAGYQRPKPPSFAAALAPHIRQLHSSAYRNPDQLAPGPVLLAGAGNSGAELAVEVARAGHPTFVAGRDVGELPFRIGSWLGRTVLCRLVLRLVFHRLLTANTPMGRKARPMFTTRGGPLIRTRARDLAAAGVVRVSKVVGVQDGRPVLQDGQVLDVTNVIWCTGYAPGHDFVELPIFDAEGQPRHQSGIVTAEPGLYFVGLGFLHAASSSMIHGVGRDAARVVKMIARRRTARTGARSGDDVAPRRAA